MREALSKRKMIMDTQNQKDYRLLTITVSELSKVTGRGSIKNMLCSPILENKN